MNTPTLAKLMLKENYELRNYVTTFQAKINDLSSMAALVAEGVPVICRQILVC